MRTKSSLIYLFLIQVSFLVSCSKENNRLITADLKQTIEIEKGDLLIVNLGSFGDEEGAQILTAPKNARESKIEREVNSGIINYRYIPLDNFSGKDSVSIILNRGSDGAGSGANDTTSITIIVK